MYEIVEWLFDHHYGKINGCARSKCFGFLGAISPPNCTPVYKKEGCHNYCYCNREDAKRMILDATCGLKQMWFQKDDQETVYLDMRHGAIQYSEKQFKRRPDYRNRIINPTIQADNRYLPFKDGVFDMILFDPPHMITNTESSELQHTYSVLNPITWTKDMSSQIKELFRVLKPKGFFIFKWAENSATIKEALKLFPCKPLFGSNPQNPKHKTWWIVFRKD